jgi:DNA-binding transcriptional MerR regulator/effector-binding domain-containing protein
MAVLLTIGEFSRLTHVSVKALRHYHDVGLLEPADVDSSTGYRFYATAQIPTAQVIRRFRELDMPLDQVKAVLDATDVAARDETIVAHLQRMESQLEQTQGAVAALRALLDGPRSASPVEYRTVESTPAVAVRGRVLWEEAEPWLAAAFDDLYATLGGDRNRRVGPDGALYSSEFFESHFGDVVALVPIDAPAETSGRTEIIEVPAGRFAVAVHEGPFAELDQTYGALGTFVLEHALGAGGAIRENYLITADDTDDPAALRTEVCWPITADALA